MSTDSPGLRTLEENQKLQKPRLVTEAHSDDPVSSEVSNALAGTAPSVTEGTLLNTEQKQRISFERFSAQVRSSRALALAALALAALALAALGSRVSRFEELLKLGDTKAVLDALCKFKDEGVVAAAYDAWKYRLVACRRFEDATRDNGKWAGEYMIHHRRKDQKVRGEQLNADVFDFRHQIMQLLTVSRLHCWTLPPTIKFLAVRLTRNRNGTRNISASPIRLNAWSFRPVKIFRGFDVHTGRITWKIQSQGPEIVSSLGAATFDFGDTGTPLANAQRATQEAASNEAYPKASLPKKGQRDVLQYAQDNDPWDGLLHPFIFHYWLLRSRLDSYQLALDELSQHETQPLGDLPKRLLVRNQHCRSEAFLQREKHNGDERELDLSLHHLPRAEKCFWLGYRLPSLVSWRKRPSSSRRGRGQRRDKSYWNARKRDPCFNPFLRECLFSDGGPPQPAIARLDSTSDMPFCVSLRYLRSIGKEHEISTQVKDSTSHSIGNRKAQGIIRNMSFRVIGTSLTFRNSFYVYDMLDDFVDVVFGWHFMAGNCNLLFDKAFDMFSEAKSTIQHATTNFSTKISKAYSEVQRRASTFINHAPSPSPPYSLCDVFAPDFTVRPKIL